MNTITLYPDKVPGAARAIWASVHGTTLRVELQDLGDNVPAASMCMESRVSVCSCSVNTCETNDQVFDWLKAKFSKISALDDLIEYLDKNNIHYHAFSF